MYIFLSIFFSLYGAMHFYAFTKARAAFQFGLRTGICISVIFLFMIVAPVVVRLAENAGYDTFARITAYCGYLWLSVIFLFISSALLLELYRLLSWLSSVIYASPIRLTQLSAKTLFYAPLAIALCITAFGYFDALNIRTEYLKLETEKLPEGRDRIRIVQISDVHVGLIVREERLGLILQKVREADADILVSTGDLLDGQINGLAAQTAMLRDLNMRLGKYAVTGNHEFFAGIKPALAFFEATGFRLLRCEGVNIEESITLVGVDDPVSIRAKENPDCNEAALLAAQPPDRYRVLLKHRPLIGKDSSGLFDLQLSGHVHKGQIFPFSILTHLYYPKHAGIMQVNGSTLYVSRGSGTWGPPVRFLATPEVTVIDIVRKK